jgi:spore germination protein KC
MSIAMLIVICTLWLTSCWDRQEVNDVAIVLTTSIDLEDDGTYRISYLLPLPRHLAGSTQGGSAGGKPYYVDSESASTISDAMSKVQTRMSRRITMSHQRTIILSEKLARQGIDFIFDFFPRYYESRLSTLLIVCKGTGADLLQADPKFERFPSEAAREIIYGINGYSVDLRQVGIALSYGSDPIIPYIQVQEIGGDQDRSKELMHVGYAQFQNQKMVDVFRGDASHGLLWLLNQPREYVLNLSHVTQKPTSISVLHGRTSIVPTLSNDQLHVHIHVKVSCRLREDYSKQDMMNSKHNTNLEKQVSSEIKKQIEKTFKQMQTHVTDSAQLAQMAWRKYPSINLSDMLIKWKHQMARTPYTITVEAQLMDTGLIYKNITDRIRS